MTAIQTSAASFDTPSIDPFHRKQLGRLGSECQDLLKTWESALQLPERLIDQIKQSPVESLTDRVMSEVTKLLEPLTSNAEQCIVSLKLFGGASSNFDIHRSIETIASGRLDSVDEVCSVADRMLGLLKKVDGEFKAVDRRIAEHIARIQLLEIELNLPHTEKTSVDRLDEAKIVEERLSDKVGELRAQIEVQVAEVKSQVFNLINEINQNFDTTGVPEMMMLEVDKLSATATQTSSLREAVSALALVEDYRAKLGILSSARRFEPLKADCIESRGSVAKSVDLIFWLNRKKRHKEALALLVVLQSAFPFEEADIDDFSFFVEAMLEASIEACADGQMDIWWPELVIRQPWMSSMEEVDIKSQDTRIKLILILLIVGQKEGYDEWKKLFYQWNAPVHFLHTKTPLLKDIVEDIMSGHSVVIGDGKEAKHYEKKKAEVDDFFLYDADHSRFFVQIAKGNRFHEMERDHLLPRLKEIASSVTDCCERLDFDTAVSLLRAQKADKLFVKACQNHNIDPWESNYFAQETVGVHGYVPKVLRLCDELIAARKAMPSFKVIDAESLTHELQAIQRTDSSRFWPDLCSYAKEKPKSRLLQSVELLPLLCTFDPAVAALAHTYVAQYTSAPDLIFEDENEARVRMRRVYHDMINVIPESCYDRKIVEALCTSKSYYHAAQLAAIIPDCAIEVEELQKQARECEERILKGIKEINTSLVSAVPEWEKWIEFRCHNALEKWLDSYREQKLRSAVLTAREKITNVRHVLDKELSDLRTMTDSKGFPASLSDFMLDLIAKCDRGFRRLLKDNESDFDGKFHALQSCVEGVRFAIEHRDSQAADEVSYKIQVLELGPSAAKTIDLLDVEVSEVDRRNTEAAMDAWRMLSSPSETRLTNDAIKHLLTAFCLRCRLYAQTSEDYKVGTRLEFAELNLSGLRIGVSKMRFPRNNYLADTISLYVIPGDLPSSSHVDEVVARIESRPHLHVVFVPAHSKVAAHVSKRSRASKKGVVIGPGEISIVLNDAEPRRHLARRFLQQASQVASSPFLFSGVVHENQLFAGREDEIQGLVSQPRGSLCGGRRIGKTSLVHAVRLRLAELKWKIAYEDLQHFRPSEGTVHAHIVGHWDVALLKARPQQKVDLNEDDPDLKVARDIARSLGMQMPVSLDNFAADLIQLAQETKVAILMDEIDCYIKASRWYHGDQKFPLMSALRRVEQSVQGGQMKVLMAGFKELHYESHRDDVSDPSYPFRNWMRSIPLGPLKYKNTSNQLIRDGLVEQLGYNLSVDACRKIHDLASGHPAFLQFFCDQLDQRNRDRLLDGQSSLGVAEVMDVYRACSSLDGQHTYLSFVDQTLGYNLDPLERAIILTMALGFKQEGEKGEIVSQFSILTELEQYFGIMGVQPPSKAQVSWAFENLAMVGILKKHEPSNYQLAYSSYFDILSRLNQMEKSNLEEAIKSFEEMRYVIQRPTA